MEVQLDIVKHDLQNSLKNQFVKVNAARKEKEQAVHDNAKLDSSVGKLPMKFAKLNTSHTTPHISPLDAKSEALDGGDKQIHEYQRSLQRQLNQKIFSKRQVLSLVSQGNHEIRIELILDKDVLNFGQKHIEIANETNKSIQLNDDKACLTCYINVMSKDYLLTDSEVGWLSSSKLLLTINNEFFLLNTNPEGLREVDN